MKLYKVVLVVVALLIMNNSIAGLYTWTDAEGNKHFGDQIPKQFQGEEKKLPTFKPTMDVSKKNLIGVWRGIDFKGQKHEWIIKKKGRITMFHRNPYSNEKMFTAGKWKILTNKLAIDITSKEHTDTQGVKVNQDDLRKLNVSILHLKENHMTVLINGDRIRLNKTN